MTIQTKATKQPFPAVMFIMYNWCTRKYYPFESVDEILKYDHSNESYWAVLSCGAVYYVVQDGSNFKSVDDILKCDYSHESFQVFLLWLPYKDAPTFECFEWNPAHIQQKSNESFWARRRLSFRKLTIVRVHVQISKLNMHNKIRGWVFTTSFSFLQIKGVFDDVANCFHNLFV